MRYNFIEKWLLLALNGTHRLFINAGTSEKKYGCPYTFHNSPRETFTPPCNGNNKCHTHTMHDVEILNHAQYNRQQQEKSNCCAVVGRCTEEKKKKPTQGRNSIQKILNLSTKRVIKTYVKILWWKYGRHSTAAGLTHTHTHKKTHWIWAEWTGRERGIIRGKYTHDTDSSDHAN